LAAGVLGSAAGEQNEQRKKCEGGETGGMLEHGQSP